MLRFRSALGVQVLCFSLLVASPALAQSFADDFAIDSTGGYTLTLINPQEGTGTLVYDAPGQRAQILTGNDFGLRVAHDLPSRTTGRLSVDLLPTEKWPVGGQISIRLRQDAANYYEISNFDGQGPGSLRKIVGGLVVDTVSFTAGYVQNVAYPVRFDFTPELSELWAFGQVLEIDQDTSPLAIASLEIETYQQSAYVDNISYGDIVNFAPLADAGLDHAVADGDLVQLDGSASSDIDGSIATYSWQQLSGPTVALSDASSASPTFVAPDPGSGSVALVFELTVTDDAGAPASDTVQIDAWSSDFVNFSDDFSSDTTGGYTLTRINPQEGTGTLFYDAPGQRAQILTGNDFGLRVARTLPPRSSGHFALTLLPTKKYPSGGQIFVRLLQDAENYYEIENSDGYGPGSLTKVVGGQIVDVASFASGYLQNRTYPLVFDFSAGLTTLDAFGQFLALEQDATPLQIMQLEIEAYQQDVYFDDLSLSDFVEQPPFVRLTAPAENLFQSSTTLRAEVFGFRLQPGWRVAFAVDVATPDELLSVDPAAPFVVDFANVSKGTHTVDAYVVNASGAQVSGAELHDQVSGVDIGDYYVGVGDSITLGQNDNIAADNVSADGRDSGGGYEPILNDLLTAELGYAHTVRNEGVGGKTSLWGASKINGILNEHPDAVFFLVLFGTNDSKDENAVASATYKANMQSVVSAILARGKTPILAKIPIAYGNCGRCSPYPDPQSAAQNVRIRAYNQAIDELNAENSLPIAGPDLYTHFAQHPEQMGDRLHPNGIGYQAIADLWAGALLAP